MNGPFSSLGMFQIANSFLKAHSGVVQSDTPNRGKSIIQFNILWECLNSNQKSGLNRTLGPFMIRTYVK